MHFFDFASIFFLFDFDFKSGTTTFGSFYHPELIATLSNSINFDG